MAVKKRNIKKQREKKRKKKRQKPSVYFDYNLLFIVIFLICFGLVMLYSSSSYIAANKFQDGAYYLKEQIKKETVKSKFFIKISGNF